MGNPDNKDKSMPTAVGPCSHLLSGKLLRGYSAGKKGEGVTKQEDLYGSPVGMFNCVGALFIVKFLKEMACIFWIESMCL